MFPSPSGSRGRASLFIVLALALARGTVAFAEPYAVITQSRALAAHAEAEFQPPAVTDDKSESSVELGSFDRALRATAVDPGVLPLDEARGEAFVSQRVDYGPSAITGSFALDVRNVGGRPNRGGRGDDQWANTFRVDQPTPFDLSGELRLSGLDGTSSTDGRLSFRLSDRYAFSGGGGFAGVREDFHVTGTLLPGETYAFDARLSGFAGDAGDRVAGSINFTLALIPEPGAMWVLGVGAALLARRRRRPVIQPDGI